MGLSWICLFLAVFFPSINGSFARGVNGGVDCATCTIALGVIEHLSILYNESIVVSLERFCNYMPSQFKLYCKEAVEFLGKFFLVRLIRERENNVLRSNYCRRFSEE
jgi:hypothetical protein